MSASCSVSFTCSKSNRMSHWLVTLLFFELKGCQMATTEETLWSSNTCKWEKLLNWVTVDILGKEDTNVLPLWEASWLTTYKINEKKNLIFHQNGLQNLGCLQMKSRMSFNMTQGHRNFLFSIFPLKQSFYQLSSSIWILSHGAFNIIVYQLQVMINCSEEWKSTHKIFWME